MNKDAYIQFWDKFATMIGNGVPLVATLRTLEKENEDNVFGQVLGRVIKMLVSGKKFSKCLENFPLFFGADIVQLISGGESMGRLDKVAEVVAKKLGEGILSFPDDDATFDETVEVNVDGLLIETVFAEAVKVGATDIHIEPLFNGTKVSSGRVRFRIDGVLTSHCEISVELIKLFMSRLKALACLSIGETKLPQDGRIRIKIKEEHVDLQVSIGPTVFGEEACIKVISEKPLSTILDSPEIIFPDEKLRNRIYKDLESSSGLFVVTGPTGSGKTTSAYTLLARYDGEKNKILSVEDPVEYCLPGVQHIQARPSLGLTYQNVLRHIMSMDPDIIFCSEIREPETAGLLVKIAMTGHTVFTQLFTENAVSAVSRLLDIGVEYYALSDVLLGVLSQRLVRRLCPHCKTRSEEQLKRLQEMSKIPVEDNVELFEAVGCEKCSQTGYKGRQAVYEYLSMTSEFKKVIRSNPSVDDLTAAAKDQGIHTFLENALPVLLRGETSLAEVLRIL